MGDGYLGNSHLKKVQEQIEWTPELLQEYMKCAEDPVYFSKKYIKIVHVDRGLVPFDMYDYQKEICDKIFNNRRVAVLTARQSGKTTTACAVILHYILFNEFKLSLLIKEMPPERLWLELSWHMKHYLSGYNKALRSGIKVT